MASYAIEWKTSAEKELRKIARDRLPAILTAVESLANNPFPTGVRKMAGAQSAYRIRIGDYRVVYIVDTGSKIVLIQRVRHRKDVYRG